jgi:hypothetical protein
MLTPDKVSACLVTRGDQPEQLARIVATLPYDEVIVWDNSRMPDLKTAGRYGAMLYARTRFVYFQDDDTLFERHDELLDAYDGMADLGYAICATNGHGATDGGYGDLPLVCGGALADRNQVLDAMGRYRRDEPIWNWPEEDLYYSDFAIGVCLSNWISADLPFEINMEIAQHPSRLCNQPWAADAKRRVTERARAIRDGALSVA